MSDVQKVIDKADKLSEEFELLKTKLDKVIFHLEDDATTGTKGLISRLTAVEKALTDIDTKAQVEKGRRGVYYVSGGALIWIIANFDKVISFFSRIEIK